MKMFVADMSKRRTNPLKRTLVISERAISSLGAAFLIMRSDSSVGGYGVVRNMGSVLMLIDVLPIPGKSECLDYRVAARNVQERLAAQCHMPANLAWTMGKNTLRVSDNCKRATLKTPKDEYYELEVADGGLAWASAISLEDNTYYSEDLAVRWDYGRFMELANDCKLSELNEPYVSAIETIPFVETNIIALDDPPARSVVQRAEDFRIWPSSNTQVATVADVQVGLHKPTATQPATSPNALRSAVNQAGWTLHWLAPPREVCEALLGTLSRSEASPSGAPLRKILAHTISQSGAPDEVKTTAIDLLKATPRDGSSDAWCYIFPDANKASISVFISEEVPGIIMPAELQLLTCAYYVVKKTLLTAEEVRAACKAIDDDGS